MVVTKHSIRADSLSKWDWLITALVYPGGRSRAVYLCYSCLITLTWQDGQSHKYQSNLTADTHWLMPWLFSCVFFFFFEKNFSSTGYQWPQTYIIKLNRASTAIKPHLQYQHSILQIIHSLLWISQTIRALPGDWVNGSIWAFPDTLTGSCASASSRQPRHPAFYKAVSCVVSSPEIRMHQQRVSIHIDR